MIIVRELTGGIYYGTPRGISGSGPKRARSIP
jgi:3-isopropylmalate dehydrogenase